MYLDSSSRSARQHANSYSPVYRNPCCPRSAEGRQTLTAVVGTGTLWHQQQLTQSHQTWCRQTDTGQSWRCTASLTWTPSGARTCRLNTTTDRHWSELKMYSVSDLDTIGCQNVPSKHHRQTRPNRLRIIIFSSTPSWTNLAHFSHLVWLWHIWINQLKGCIEELSNFSYLLLAAVALFRLCMFRSVSVRFIVGFFKEKYVWIFQKVS